MYRSLQAVRYVERQMASKSCSAVVRRRQLGDHYAFVKEEKISGLMRAQSITAQNKSHRVSEMYEPLLFYEKEKVGPGCLAEVMKGFYSGSKVTHRAL